MCGTPLHVLSEIVTSSFDGVHFGRTALGRPGSSLNGVLVTGAGGMLGRVECDGGWFAADCARVECKREVL